MKAIFRSAHQGMSNVSEWKASYPLLVRSLQLLLTVSLYLGVGYAVVLASHDARIPVVLYAVYFLPAVLRAWLQFYWCLRGHLSELVGHRSANRAF